ncbi:aminopeptidase N [Drosophila grimshawi]|uniref:aminopeptidase N n=1 Tax=Drosophila grimshawi TaxID=7222 RepID=UPI001C934277|nr:aminopeptidase N [Drosophila grimshawi]
MQAFLYYFTSLLLATGVLCIYNPYRLPNVIRPKHYDLRILTHLNGRDQLHFEGRVKIDFQVQQPTNNITLHAKNLTIDDSQITLSAHNGLKTNIIKTELNKEKEFYIMHVAGELPESEQYELMIPFKAQLSENDTGYYWSSYNDSFTEKTHYLAATQFSPTFGRTAFPCFDEPHLRATFRVTLGYHRNYTGLSNTPVRNCEAHETLENYIWCEHEPLLPTSTYLVAYSVHNLSSVPSPPSDTIHNVRFRSWMQPKVVGESEFCVNFAPKTLSYLEQLFEYPFPLSKVDQLAMPTHKFSAMENWGLTTFKQSHFVHNDTEELQQAKESKAQTVAHEYAHQWFGNLVALNWWNDLWLKEGPSTYFAYLTLDALMPDWGSSQRLIGNDLAKFFQDDMINNSIAISRQVQDSKSVLEQFSPYVYKKGSLTMRMLHLLLGDEVFFLAIRNYLKRHAYGSVTQSELFGDMQQAADLKDALSPDIQLSTVMDSWTLQGGYPLVHVVRDYERGSVQLNQSLFLLTNKSKEQSESCWWIPLTFVIQQNANFNETQPQFWLKCPRAQQTQQLLKKPKSDEWIMLNPQVNSIYRVNYDERNWQLIIQTLNSSEHSNDIHVLNRAQLMDDLMALAWTNQQSYDLALSMLEYLPREQELLPWNTILNLLNNHGELLRGDQSSIFRAFMQKLVSPLYARCPKVNSVAARTKSSPLIALYRLAYSQACRYQLDDCIDQALSLGQFTEQIEEVPINFRDIMSCASIEHGIQEQFQSMLQRFKNSTIESRKTAWAKELGCSRNFSQLQEFLDYLLQSTDKTTKTYYIVVVNSALQRQNVALQTADHVLQHAKILNDKFSSREIKSLLLTIIGNSHSQLDELKLRQQLKGLDKFEKHLGAALHIRNINLNWLAQRSVNFIAALSKYI